VKYKLIDYLVSKSQLAIYLMKNMSACIRAVGIMLSSLF